MFNIAYNTSLLFNNLNAFDIQSEVVEWMLYIIKLNKDLSFVTI